MKEDLSHFLPEIQLGSNLDGAFFAIIVKKSLTIFVKKFQHVGMNLNKALGAVGDIRHNNHYVGKANILSILTNLVNSNSLRQKTIH